MVMLRVTIKACALAASLLAASPLLADDYTDLVAAERAFAADASARGTRAAFLAALAEDGLVFEAGPTSGRRHWESRPEDGSKLEWAPEVAEVSAGGDLGYTSGPWQFTPPGAEAPVAFGHYLSVWRKGADGRWSLLIDHGVIVRGCVRGAVARIGQVGVRRRSGVGAVAAVHTGVGQPAAALFEDLVAAGVDDGGTTSAQHHERQDKRSAVVHRL